MSVPGLRSVANPIRMIATLYRDDHVIVVDKPSGWLVHRGWGRDRVVLVDAVKVRVGGGVVHPIGRLDRGASGVMLFALTQEAARVLGDAARRPFEKTYLALVRGETPADGVIDHPLPRRSDGLRVTAVTRFRRLAVIDARPRTLSWVEAIPEQGRLHQVRRHLKHISHPIVGDANYGVGALNREVAATYGLTRLALHAGRVAFEHPVGGRPVEVAAPVPADLTEALARMGLALPIHNPH